MRIIDFDEKFYEFTCAWMKQHPEVTAKQVEESYNALMEKWVNTPAEWLDGAAPAHYFDRYEKPEELISLLRGYLKSNVGLPEPLFTRIVEKGNDCAHLLRKLLQDDAQDEEARVNALSLLNAIGDPELEALMTSFVISAQERSELSEMASDFLSNGSGACVRNLLDAYNGASDYAQRLILDIAVNFPGDERICTYLLRRLMNRPEERAMNASLLGKLGDPRALETLTKMLSLFDLRYLDYIELRNAVEELGGDSGPERTFYGDPDYEALRSME